jgi:hypothetical protein
VRLQHPVALTLLAFRPRRPLTREPGRPGFALDAAYSSIFMNDTNAAGDMVLLDGEVLHTSLRARAGLGERTDVELELPFLYATSGFLDAFVDGWHELFGLPGGNRRSRPQDGFAMHWESEGQRVWELEGDRIGLLDIPVIVTHTLVEESERNVGLAVRAGVQVPTGSESRGFSNGELDYGLGALFERSRGRWTFSGAADLVFVGRSAAFRAAGIELDDLWDLQLGIEYRWSDRVSLLSQSILTGPLSGDIELVQTTLPTFDFALGCVWDMPWDSRLIGTFREDLISEAGPDFAFAVSWVFGL